MENLNPVELEIAAIDREHYNAHLGDYYMDPSAEWFEAQRRAIVKRSLIKKADRPAVKYARKEW